MAARRPPEPTGDHGVIGEWIAGSMPKIQPLLRHLDAMVRKAIPGAQYAVKWKKAYYGTPRRGWIIELAGYHVSANLVFLTGAKLDPPPPHGEGAGRYVKLHGIEEADDPQLRKWLEQAAKLPGWSAD